MRPANSACTIGPEKKDRFVGHHTSPCGSAVASNGKRLARCDIEGGAGRIIPDAAVPVIARALKADGRLFVGERTWRVESEGFGELASSLGAVLPFAQKVGVSFDEVAATTAALTKGGISTSVAVIGRRAALIAVLSPTEQALTLAKDLKLANGDGLDFSVASLEAKGFAQFMRGITEATGGSVEQLSALFSSSEAGAVAMSLAGEAGKFLADNMEAMGKKAGQAQKAFDLIDVTWAERYDQAIVGISNTLTRLAAGALLTVISAAELAGSALTALIDNADILGVSLAVLSASRLPALTGGITSTVAWLGTMSGAMTVAVYQARALAFAMNAVPFVAVVSGLRFAYRAYAEAEAHPEASKLVAESKARLNEQLEIYATSRAPAAKTAIEGERRALIENARANLIASEATLKMFEANRNGMNPALRDSAVMIEASERVLKYRSELDGLRRTLAAFEMGSLGSISGCIFVAKNSQRTFTRGA
ncbi:phage tail tape measure protein [Puniceibacterium sp. IMCC21224]|uniref:phage tail tape measure protein n=1 Tax=Puniceibacterium sp. IMCC21224 TaxID=1618204 RepID=UPI0012E020C3|nr:phage tail tape measure protein [Puniceibacterium sp. IMCC21224]